MIWRFIHLDNEGIERTREQQRQQETTNRNNSEYIKRKRTIEKSDIRNKTIDVKGAITLALTITSFLLLLTYLQTGGTNNTRNISSAIQIAGFLFVGIISFALFILVEKSSTSPLVDFGLLLNKRMLPANIIIMIVGFSMFMVFQTIPIFVENPAPVGFGENAINATKVLLPFALVLLVFGPASGLIISKLGSMKPIIIGTVVLAIGLFGLTVFHSTEFLLSVNLAILSIGISLSNVGAQNVIILSTPRQNSGISLGITTLLRIIASSIAPVVAAMFMEASQYTVIIGGKPQSFPSSESFSLIFLTSTVLSMVSVSLAMVLFRSRQPKCQNHLPEENGDMNTTITENIKEEILSWQGVTSNPYRFGGIEFRVNERDMGHIHGEKHADLPFPIEIRKYLIASGKALPHIIYPESMWVSYFIRNEEDAPQIVDLFRLQYDRLKYKHSITRPKF
ncbi:MAG: MFS transporter [Candidatus Nitrosopolaris sp.]